MKDVRVGELDANGRVVLEENTDELGLPAALQKVAVFAINAEQHEVVLKRACFKARQHCAVNSIDESEMCVLRVREPILLKSMRRLRT